MKIGFDLDKIFIDLPPLVPTEIIDWFYKERANHQLKYRIPSKLEQVVRVLSHHPFLRPPILNNLNYVKNLALTNKNKSSTFFLQNKTLNHSNPEKVLDKYYLISSRFGFLKNRTDELIKRYALDKIFNEMYFNYSNNQPHIFKNEVIKKINLDMYVDDDLQLLDYLIDRNPKTKFFWLNKNLNKKLSDNLFAITKLSKMFG